MVKHSPPFPASSLHWLADGVKEPTEFSQRVENIAPNVVVWPCHCLYWPPF